MTKLRAFPDGEKIHNTRMYHEYHDLGMEDGWLPNNQQDNFHFMTKLMELTGIPLPGTHCLDVGCGSGDLSLFLRQRGISSYLGVDIYDISLEKARNKYPQETFLHTDILSEDLQQMFDYAFCSGSLTVKFKTIDNYDFLSAMIEKMWELTRIGLVFNVLTDDDTLPDPDLFFYSQEKVQKICQKIIGKSNNLFVEKTPNICQIHVYLWR
ncbi:class I SAM-dependent methyltransferase [soil metagenome]